MAEPDRAREQEEDEVYKSHNKPAKVAAKLTSEFEKGDKVDMKVKTDNKTMFLPFWVADSRYSGVTWEHQLKTQDGKLHDGGAWYAEGVLRSSK